MSGIVLSLCDLSGVMVQPWLDAGFECWIVDTQHKAGEHRDGNLIRVGADVTRWLPPRVDYQVVFGFPPCTDLATSGARWMKDKGLPALASSLDLVERCRAICEWSGAPWMIENPVGTLSSYWRTADYTFHPYEYGGYSDDDADAYTKRTLLWTSDDFVMPATKAVEPVQGSKISDMGESKARKNMRSKTPLGFARAVFSANSGSPMSTPTTVDHELRLDLAA